jgi:hypothetical protein
MNLATARLPIATPACAVAKCLHVGSVDLECRRLTIPRKHAETDASARMIKLNADGSEAAARCFLGIRRSRGTWA